MSILADSPPPLADLQHLLRHCALLRDFSRDELGQFATALDVLTYPPGATVIVEGEAGGDLYIVLDGDASVERRHMELERLTPGSVFGELALLTSRPRAATVTAKHTLQVARLSEPVYRRLVANAPGLAAKFLEAVVAHVGAELVAMTENMRVLLSDRAPARRATVTVQLAGAARTVSTGTPVQFLLPPTQDGARVVAALLDHKAISLRSRLFADGLLEPLTLGRADGREIFVRSAGLTLLEAVRQVHPQAVVELGTVYGAAQVVESDSALDVDAVDARLQALIQEIRPLRVEHWSVDAATAYFRQNGWEDAARQLRVWRSATVPLAGCGEVLALSTGPLLPSTEALRGVHLRIQDGQVLLDLGPEVRHELVYPAHLTPQELDRPPPPPPELGDMLVDQRKWLRMLGATGVGGFNDLCIDGRVTELIRVAEGFHEKRLGRLADLIAGKKDALRVICIAGPSSSGKTTFIKRLTVQLQVNGVRPVAISLDDYYVDRARTPLDAAGEYDFEALNALDLPLLQDHVTRLLRGERVRLARYDFKTGVGDPGGGAELQLAPGDVLMMEGIHGLNPQLLGDVVPSAALFRLYIHPATALRFDRLTQVSTADMRLIRRIVRDRHARGYSAADTIARWPSVVRGERLHILPFLPHATAVFDSSLAYEPSVLKVYADRYLLEVPPDHPSLTTALRLRHLLDRFVTIYPDHVPPTSVLREFVGGSGFEY